MVPPNHFFEGMGLELVYSFAIIVCSLMVYFGTKELYELSSYKGLKYFRQAFLFFAAAYIFKYFIGLLLFFLGIAWILDVSPRILGTFTLLTFMYLSAMAVFYLLYSVLWKKWESRPWLLYLFHAVAITLSAAAILLRRREALLGFNVFLLLFVIASVCMAYNYSKGRHRKHKLYIVYLLLLFFWILNIVDVLVPMFFQVFKLAVYLASILMFLLILYKVLRKATAG